MMVAPSFFCLKTTIAFLNSMDGRGCVRLMCAPVVVGEDVVGACVLMPIRMFR